jgi:hypothetical protein
MITIIVIETKSEQHERTLSTMNTPKQAHVKSR